MFLPALIFVNLGTSVTGPKLLLWWPLPVNVALNCALGMLMGRAAAPLVGTPKHLRKVFICTAGVGAPLGSCARAPGAATRCTAGRNPPLAVAPPECSSR